MPKKNSGTIGADGIILQKPMEEILHESMLPYAEYVILERALPRAEDGLKPVQRRILYTMQELSLMPDKPHRKSARIVGDCLGKYHPHGDSSVYDAMVRMAQGFNMRGTLVDGHGNFGSIDGDTAAAMRYTEVRMTPLALELLRDINKDTVDHQWNFDDTLEEPCVLPARFPNLLVNGASGIAVGLATNIPPHNLRESVEAVIAQIDNPDITVDQLMQIIPGPDFPTGGILLHSNEIRTAYETGRGRLLVRAKVDIEKEKNGKQLLVITEVPFQVNKATMLEKILKLSEEKKGPLTAISDIRDESDRDGLRAVIELKKDADAQLVLAYLYKYSDLQVTFGVNIVAIAGGRPHQMGLKEVIGHYIAHQKDVVTRRTRYDLDNAKKRAHILEGLMIALNDLDRAIALIRGSKDGPTARVALMEAFSLTEVQAQAILDLRLQRLTNLEILTLRKEYDDLLKLIGELEAILGNEKKLLKLIKKELTVVMNQYADERRTVILKEEPTALPDFTKQQAAPEEACVLLTANGFIKRVAPRFLQKPEDFADDPPRATILTDTNRRIIFFTDFGNVYTVNVPSIAECRPKDRGLLPAALLEGLEDGERVIRAFGADDYGEFLFATKKGQIKRTSAAEYGARKGKLAAIKLRTGDSLLYVEKLLPEHSMMLITKAGASIHFTLDEVPVNGRVSGGVRGITLDAVDEVKAAVQIQTEGEILLISDRGYAKRNLIIDHDPQGRGGKGLKAFIFNRNGSNGSCIAGAVWVRDPAELIIRQAGGETSRLFSEEVMIEQRASRGTPVLMALMDNVVVSIEKA